MIRLWKGDSGSPILNLREADGTDLPGIAFSPDGKTIAALVDGAIHLWELEPPSDGYALRRRSQIAARLVEARADQRGLSPDAVSGIRGDTTVPDEVRRIAVRLAEDRLWAAQAIEREKHARLREITKEKLEQYRQVAAAPDVTAEALNSYAWALVTIDPQMAADLESEFPNASRTAVDIAKRGVELTPQDGNIWNTLGVAQYRASEWQPAVDSLEKAAKLRGGGDAFDWFFLAMAHWQLDHKDEARQWYDKAVEWMDKNNPKNEELLRFRAEAAELLGVTHPQPSSDSSDQPSSPTPASP
jgi:tetratricopeptide (TPR) repeat protein